MPVLVTLVCAAVFTAGLVIMTRSAGLMWRCRQASRWPSTSAILLEVEDQDILGPEDTNHRIRVRYTYEVDGQRHEGNLIHPCYTGGSRFGQAHSKLLAVLKPGQRYRVRYNRNRPDESMLSAGFHLHSIFPLLVGIQALLLAAGLMAELGLNLGLGLFLPFGINFALILLVLLLSRDRFASRIIRTAS